MNTKAKKTKKQTKEDKTKQTKHTLVFAHTKVTTTTSQHLLTLGRFILSHHTIVNVQQF